VRRAALARLGFAATGVLYVALGATAARIAVAGARDPALGMGGALRVLLRQPHGRILLTAVAAGFAAFGLWHALEARNARRMVLERLGHLFGVAGYAALLWSAVTTLVHARRGDGALQQSALAWLLSRPWGVALVEVAGAATIGAGLFEIGQGASGRLRNRFATQWLPRTAARFLHRVARFGLASRGVVLVVIGFFQVRVARDLDPRELREIGGALNVLSRLPAGGVALGAVVAAGLAAYGVYMIVLALAGRRRG